MTTIETLRRILLGDLSPQVESALSEIRSMRIEGAALIRRLAALLERYRLNPRDNTEGAQGAEPQVIRVVCSDRLTGYAKSGGWCATYTYGQRTSVTHLASVYP